MTDIYIAYARQDRDSVRLLAEMLQFEGWDVWMDPSEPSADTSAATDIKLGSAGAILAVWSHNSRNSEFVRAEAATGLYKNKLIQVRLDSAPPPRPYDQVEVIDLTAWTPDREDPSWRRILAAVRLYAGAPGSARPQVVRRASTGPAAYLEPRRSVAWGPLLAAGVLIVGGAAMWVADPFGWRAARTALAGEATETVTLAEPGLAEDEAGMDAPSFEDTQASIESWARVNRKDPDALRAFISDHPRSSGAESARSLLRVLDAQAWVSAVTADNEAAYKIYLREFPANGAQPGAMAASATERLASLAVERKQAIEEIQAGLKTLKLYSGVVDGKGGDGTVRAIRAFAAQQNRAYPTLSTAAPRDLRAFAELVQRALSAKTGATPAVEARPSPAAPDAGAAAEADRQRLAQAQAAIEAANQAATQAAARPAPPPPRSVDSLALDQQARIADAAAWAEAQRIGTLASYRSYLAAHPAGTQAVAARAEIERLSRPAAFSLDLVGGDVRAAVEAARRAQASANARAQAARSTAASADTAPNVRSIVAADGDRYDAQISNGAPNGLGIRVSGEAANAGDRYRGELRNGQTSGLGVYEFGDNPANAQAGALRYEGEHAADRTSGFGVTYWRNGDTFAGQTGPGGPTRGVLSFSNGQRYEGELRDGTRNGFGVVWSPEGAILMAGRWVNGELVEPMPAAAGP